MDPERQRRRDALLETALGLDAAGVAALLDEVSFSDPVLRQEVERLLAVDQQLAPAFLEAGSNAWDGHPLDIGETVGRYVVQALIGAGGMSAVYRAHDAGIDRDVALKVLLPHGAGVDRTKLFFAELKVLGAFRHDHVVRVYDFGEARGLPYLVMELLEGEDLAQAIAAQHCGDVRRKLDIARQLATALKDLHAAGIMHRDVKPANVFLDTSGRVKLMDFGISRADGTEQTRTSVLWGTPEYLSPEQIQGQPATPRSDIYAYGVLLVELFSGVRPFRGSIADVLYRIVHEPLDVGTLRTTVPSAMVDLLERLTAKDPDARPKSFVEIEHLLQREDLVEASADRTAKDALPRLFRRSRIGIAATALVMLAAAAGVFVWQRLHAAPLTDKDTIVLADFTNTTGDPQFDGALRQALAFQLAQSPFLKIMDDEQVNQALRFLNRPLGEHVSNQIAHDVCVREGEKATLDGSIARIGQTYVLTLQATNCQSGESLAREQAEAENKEHVLQSLAKAATAIRSKLGESLSAIQKVDSPYSEGTQVTTSSLEALRAFSLAEDAAAKGDFAASASLFKHATELDQNFAMAFALTGIEYGNNRQPALSVQYVKQAYALIDHAVSQRERLFITSAYYQFVTRELPKAAESLELLTQLYPRDSQFHRNLGVVYGSLGEPEKALAEYRESVRLAPRMGDQLPNLEAAYLALDRFDEAKAVADNALSQQLGDPSRHHQMLLQIADVRGDQRAQEKEVQWFTGKPQEPAILQMQAQNAMLLGQDRKAKELFQRIGRADLAAVVGTVPSCEAAQPPDLLAASLCPAIPMWIDGLKQYEEALRQRPNDTLVKMAYLPFHRAVIELKNGQPGNAIDLLRSVAPYERPFPYVAYARGLAFLRLGNGSEAVREFQKVLDHRGAYWATLAYRDSFFGVARGAMLVGDTARAKKAYQDFLALYADADATNPYLIEARKEYAALH
jgi:tetratricopeptide (TPR) repeat protein